MTKIFSMGDHHFDVSSRWDECLRVHRWISDLAEQEKPDLFISTGDIYERASTPAERMAVSDLLRALAEVCPVLIVKGNHDLHRDCALLGRLRTKHPVVVEEGAGVHVFGTVAVAAMAWPDRARILARTHDDHAGEGPDALAQRLLRDAMRGLGQALSAHDGPRVAAGHFMVDGSVTSVGQPLVGLPMNVGLADLALLRAQIVLMGHIHKPQHWDHDGVPMVYSGSPYRTTYGELEEKSIVEVMFDAHGAMTWDRIATPCSRMYLTEDVWSNGSFTMEPQLHMPGVSAAHAEIRFRYTVDPDQRDAARFEAHVWKARWLEQGALDVRVEEVVNTTTRARAPEVAQAMSLADKLHALWRARNDVPEDERAQRLINKASMLETEVAS
jgi:DNA repair exonuclease SbcCD nuclease subunit